MVQIRLGHSSRLGTSPLSVTHGGVETDVDTHRGPQLLDHSPGATSCRTPILTHMSAEPRLCIALGPVWPHFDSRPPCSPFFLALLLTSLGSSPARPADITFLRCYKIVRPGVAPRACSFVVGITAPSRRSRGARPGRAGRACRSPRPGASSPGPDCGRDA